MHDIFCSSHRLPSLTAQRDVLGIKLALYTLLAPVCEGSQIIFFFTQISQYFSGTICGEMPHEYPLF